MLVALSCQTIWRQMNCGCQRCHWLQTFATRFVVVALSSFEWWLDQLWRIFTRAYWRHFSGRAPWWSPALVVLWCLSLEYCICLLLFDPRSRTMLLLARLSCIPMAPCPVNLSSVACCDFFFALDNTTLYSGKWCVVAKITTMVGNFRENHKHHNVWTCWPVAKNGISFSFLLWGSPSVQCATLSSFPRFWRCEEPCAKGRSLSLSLSFLLTLNLKRSRQLEASGSARSSYPHRRSISTSWINLFAGSFGIWQGAAQIRTKIEPTFLWPLLFVLDSGALWLWHASFEVNSGAGAVLRLLRALQYISSMLCITIVLRFFFTLQEDLAVLAFYGQRPVHCAAFTELHGKSRSLHSVHWTMLHGKAIQNM